MTHAQRQRHFFTWCVLTPLIVTGLILAAMHGTNP